jgi:hypothetical protein
MAEEPMTRQRRYLSYLLRLWQESGGDAPLWRASLEWPQSGDRQGFASLVDLFAFLEKETGLSSPGSQRSDDTECPCLLYQNSQHGPGICFRLLVSPGRGWSHGQFDARLLDGLREAVRV